MAGPRKPRLKRAKPRWVHPGQLALDFDFCPPAVEWEEDEPDAWAATAPVHLVVNAAERKPLKVLGPTSVFGAAAYLPKLARGGRRAALCAREAAQRASIVVELEDGGRRHIAIRIQETAEWKERDEARRARQIPPKAPKEMRGKGKKLAELVGGE